MVAWLDIVYCFLFSVVLIFNIAGNSLVIHIITHERGMKTPSNYLLLNLAVADLLFGVFLAPEFIFFPFFHDSAPDGVLGDWLCKLFFSSNIAWVMSRASIFTMLCLSVERYFAVCRPHTFSQRFSPKIVKMLVIVSWVYAVVVVSPLFVYTHRLLGKRDIRYLACIVIKTKFVKGHSLFLLIESICFVILMVFLLAKIAISLWCKQTIEPTGEREITEKKKKKKVTLCVLAVIVTFVVCWIPLHMKYALLTSYAGLRASTLATSVNAALDPYLFSFQSARFKVVVKKVLCCRKESS